MGCLLLLVLLLRLLPLVAHGDQLRERGSVAGVRRIHRGKSRFLITNCCLCSMDAQVDRLRRILVDSYQEGVRISRKRVRAERLRNLHCRLGLSALPCHGSLILHTAFPAACLGSSSHFYFFLF